MKINRKLTKSNMRGFPSETTEKNERLKLWLTFVSGTIRALVVALFLR
jgi:hypothetical protein